MKLFKDSFAWIGFLLVTLFLGTGCEDKWDEHYTGSVNEPVAYASIWAYLEADAELSTFTSLVKEAGYDTLLGASQAYTVWAPLNTALADLELEGPLAVRNFVENHITRGSFPYSLFVADRLVPLMNGKRMFLHGDGERLLYNDVPFDSNNIRTGNGLVHRLDGYVPYTANIWEFLTTGDGIDSLQTYINSLTEMVFDPEQSVQVGFNEEGNAVYDSVFVMSNSFLSTRGFLNSEDSIYSVLLLSDGAWTEAYAQIRPRYNFPSARGGLQRSEELSRQAMVDHLVLRTDGRDISGLDSVVSTADEIFYNPGYLFAGAELVDLSNGRGFRTSHYPFVDTLTWLQPIELEAEEPSGRSFANFFHSVRSGRSVEEEVSGSFLILESSLPGNSPKSSVTFTLPDILAGKYKLYVEFLPTTIDDPNKQLPSKASFMITHLNTDAGGSRRVRVSGPLETNPASKTKLFVTELDLPYANIQSDEHSAPAMTIQITNETKLEEETAGAYTRSMRIDRIVLEPVVESFVE